MKSVELKELLAAGDTGEFCDLFLKGGLDSAGRSALLREACCYSSRLPPPKYEPPLCFIPHSHMGLVAAWQMAECLPEAERWRPLLQSMWYLAEDVKRWGVREVPAPIIKSPPRGLGRALREACEGSDAEALYSLYVASRTNPETSGLAKSALLSLALQDHTNIGHKLISLVKAFQLEENTGWDDPELFYQPLHFMAVAPQDRRLFLAAQAALGPHVDKLLGVGPVASPIPSGESARLREAVLGSDEDVLKLLLGWLERGYSPASIADSLLLAAAGLVYCSPAGDPGFWWVYPVHSFQFAGAVGYSLRFLDEEDRLLAVLISGLHLRDAFRSVGGIGADDSFDSRDALARVSWEELEQAVEEGDAAGAVAQAKGLVSRSNPAELAQRLVGLTSRDESFLFTHIIKYLYYLLPSVSYPSPQYTQHLAAFVRLLALTVKEREVFRTAEAIRVA